MGPAERGLYDAAGMVPMVAAAAGLESLGVPAPIAMGGTLGSSTYAQTGDVTQGLKSAAVGMVLPALGQIGRLAVAKTLASAAEKGLISGNATLAQKALEAVGSQTLVQGALEGMNLDEYWNMPPEERKAQIIRHLVANTAFAAMEVPGIVGGGPSATEGSLGPKAKTALLIDALMKDPTAQDALRQRVDEAVFDAMNGRTTLPRAIGSFQTGTKQPFEMTKAQFLDALRNGPKELQFANPEAIHRASVEEGKTLGLVSKQVLQDYPELMGPKPAEAGTPNRNFQQVPAREDGVFDVLDAIQELGGIAAPSQSKFAEKGEYDGYGETFNNGLARYLRRSEGGLKPDELRDSLANYGFKFESTSDLYDAVAKAAKQRAAVESPEANAQSFYDAALENKGKSAGQRDKTTVPVNELKIGDVFEIKGERVRVTAIDADTGEVTVNDGPKFGTKELPADVEIFPDKGSLKQQESAVDFEPEGAMATLEKATLPRKIESETAAPALDQPVSLAEIRQYLSKALDIPVRMGINVKGGVRRALGLFMPKAETIRMKALNDIPTLAHEVGHYLHYLLFPKSGLPGATTLPPEAGDFGKSFDSELLALGARTSRKSYSQARVRREGVAEFFREWLTDRTQALAKAPGFASFFEQQLQSKFPEVWKIVSTAREQLGRYINQPAVMKVRSMVNRRPQPERTTAREWFQKQYANWVDDLAPVERSLKKLQQFGLPAAQAKMVTDYAVNYIGGWRGKVEHSLFARQIDLDGRDVGPSLREILQGVESLDDFGDYLVALRAIEKNSQGKETGIDSADAREVVRTYGLQYASKAGELRRWQRNNLLLLLDAGVLSHDQVVKMEVMNQDYVPFFRVYEGLSGGRDLKKGEGFVNLGQGVGRFKGSDRRIVDPLESIVKNAYLFRDLAERNRVGQMFVDAVEATRGGGRVAEQIARKVKPTQVSQAEMEAALEAAGIKNVVTTGGDVFSPEDMDLAFKVWRAARNQSAKDGVFTVWKDGKETPYQLGDPELMRALALADATDARFFSQIPGLGVARAFTRLLRAGATLVPEFIVRNPFRDQVTAGVFSKFGFVPFYDGFRGVFHALFRDKWYYDWMAAGGRYSDFVAMDRTDLRKTLEDVVKEPGALKVALGLANPLNVIQNLRKFSELMEQATRIAEFRLAKQAGASDVEAANASKEVTLNFARAGFKGKFWNQMIAFFNASVQDLDKTIRAHKERPLATTFKAMAYITVPSLLSWWLAKDDKEMQRLPMWRKNFFWNVNLRDLAKVAGLPMEGDFILSFPKPFLLGQLYGSSVERGLDYVNGRDPNAVRHWFGGLLQTTPISIDALAPTIARPAVEAWANRSFFRGQPLENDSMKELPPAQRLTPQSSLTGRLIAERLPWEWGVSPLKFDNTVRGYLGGLGKYGTDATDWVIAKLGFMNVPAPAEKTMWELPVLRGFVRTPYEASAYVQRFYDGLELAEQRVNAVKKMPLVMESGQAQRFIRNEKEDLAFYLGQVDGQPMITHLRNARKELGQVMKAMTMVQVSPSMSPEAKAQKLKELAGMRDRLAEAYFRTRLSPQDQRRVF